MLNDLSLYYLVYTYIYQLSKIILGHYTIKYFIIVFLFFNEPISMPLSSKTYIKKMCNCDNLIKIVTSINS